MQLRHVSTNLRQGLRRNLSMHAAVILTLFVSLSLAGIGLMLTREAQLVTKVVGSELQLTVFLCVPDEPDQPQCLTEVTPEQERAITATIVENPEVASYEVVSKAQGFENIKELLGSGAVRGARPRSSPSRTCPRRSGSRSRTPTSSTGSPAPSRTLDGVRSIQTAQELIGPIYGIMDGIRIAAWVSAGVLLLAAVMMVANTIRLAALARRREIEIMRLVGASRIFIVLPFALEALFNAIVGVALAGGALAAFTYWGIIEGLDAKFNALPFIGWPEYAHTMIVVGIAGPRADDRPDTPADPQIPQILSPLPYRRVVHFPERMAHRALLPQRHASACRSLPGSLSARSTALTVPLVAHADEDDLKNKQRDVKNRIHDAAHELEEASRRRDPGHPRAAEARRAGSTRARVQLGEVRTRLGAARERDAQLKAELAQAELDLEQANAALAAGRQAVEDQRIAVRSQVIDVYTQGDLRLRAIGSLFDARSLQEISDGRLADEVFNTRQVNIFGDLEDVEAELTDEQAEVERTAEVVEDKRREAAAHLEDMQALYAEASEAKRRVEGLVVDAESACARGPSRRASATAGSWPGSRSARTGSPTGSASSPAASATRPATPATPTATSRCRSPAATSPRPTATARTRSTATTACTTAPTSAPAAVAARRSSPRPAAP